MVEEATIAAEGTGEAQADDSTSRERSRISFPYNDLDDAEAVAKAIWEHVGPGSCEVAQVAAWLKHDSSTSGAFRLKLAAAKIFGLTETGQNSVQLTKLGRQIVDPQSASAARVSAFLAVPLYRAVYENHIGTILPNAVGLERHMADLGVPQKQTDKARQVFQRSAQQAGFFAEGNNKLVKPGLPPHEEKPDHKGGHVSGGSSGGGGEGIAMHPFVKGLVETLPDPNTEWPESARKQWLDAAAAIFRLIYRDGSPQS